MKTAILTSDSMGQSHRLETEVFYPGEQGNFVTDPLDEPSTGLNTSIATSEGFSENFPALTILNPQPERNDEMFHSQDKGAMLGTDKAILTLAPFYL